MQCLRRWPLGKPHSTVDRESKALILFKGTGSNSNVIFFVRCLWTKGETSSNFIQVVDVYLDCDKDSVRYP